VVAILGDGMGFTRQSQEKNVKEDFGRESAVASRARDAKKKIARRMLAVETQICQEQGMHIKLAPDVVAILH
jgi:hypothetical protein